MEHLQVYRHDKGVWLAVAMLLLAPEMLPAAPAPQLSDQDACSPSLTAGWEGASESGGGGTDNQRPGRGSRHVELESRGARRLNYHFAVLVAVSKSCASSQTNSRVLPLLCRPPASSASPRLPSPRSLWLRREGNRFMRDFTRVEKINQNSAVVKASHTPPTACHTLIH